MIKKANGIETFAALEDKIDQMAKYADEKLETIKKLTENIEQQEKIDVKMYLESQVRDKTVSVSLLEEKVSYHKDMAADESTAWSRELFLLSHLVFSILKNRGVSIQPVEKSSTITASFKKLAHKSPGFKFLPIAQYPNLVNYFPNDKINTKHFVLTFQDLGQVNITPSPTFSKCFIQKLIWFCRPLRSHLSRKSAK